jgi:two-component system, OmpR family, sensor histidine kinase KdpD
LRGARPASSTGVTVAVGAVALATLAIYPLKHTAPVVSLSVVYLPAILLVSTYCGLALGLATSLLSAAAFDFVHIAPVGRLTIADSRTWVALGAFMVVAIAAGTIGELARARALEAERRRGEADLAAALARELLSGADTATALAASARRVAQALGIPSAAIELGTATGDARRQALPLTGAVGERLATLLVPRALEPEAQRTLAEHVVPSLQALVSIALRRDALQAEAVETEALRRSDGVKTALLRAVSHDLRTPLTAIVAAGHALGAGSLTEPERAELSAAVVGEGGRLAVLVEKLLDLSRLQGGGAEPRSDWVSLEDVLMAARDSGTGEDGIEVRLAIEPELPEVRADAAQLERAFANLLENARRYSGGQPVSVRARQAGRQLLVSVVDRGPGIERAELERIFQPFYRGRRAAGENWTGSGLGLAIAKGFVEANGGTVSVQSLPGQGTSFVISLPVSARPAAEVHG